MFIGNRVLGLDFGPPSFAVRSTWLGDDHRVLLHPAVAAAKGNEAGVYFLADDLDWSLYTPALREEFGAVDEGDIISDKDRDAASVSDWQNDPRSANFRYSELAGSGS